MSSFGLGWQPDLPDPRDYNWQSAQVLGLLSQLHHGGETEPLPERFDLRAEDVGTSSWFPPVPDQGRRNASAIFACLGLLEYFERRLAGQVLGGSAEFLLHVVNRAQNQRTDSNSPMSLRQTFKAIRRYGVPPEELLPYQSTPSADAIDPTMLAFRDVFADLMYFRLDSGRGASELVPLLRSFLCAGFPIVFGFVVPRSLQLDGSAVIEFRPRFDSYLGGQAVLAVGYDDHKIANNQGAMLVRSSWGKQWGDNGYGWLPYSFIKHGLARDFWSCIRRTLPVSDELCVPDCLPVAG